MKANELMIGDWVICKEFGMRKITQIVIVEPTRVWLRDGKTYVPIKFIEPIPLTPEILEKNGFIKDANKDDSFTDLYHILVPTGFERNSFTIQVYLYKEPIAGVSTLVKCWGWIPPYNGGMNDIHLCSANYVHQLQHAMRLCGIGKEIEL